MLGGLDKAQICTKSRRLRVGVFGAEGIGWSVDSDHELSVSAVRASSSLTFRKRPGASDVEFYVWSPRRYRDQLRQSSARGVATVVCITNDVAIARPGVEELAPDVDLWACANHRQMDMIRELGLEAYHHPYPIASENFHPIDSSRESLANELGINLKPHLGKKIIVNYQRDSMAASLTNPKWHKDPVFLLRILESLSQDDHLIILAGPRRHWISRQLRLRNIPYLFAGADPSDRVDDDLHENKLTPERLNMLLNLAHFTICTSVSEGGPKQLVESLLAGTPALSTPVGWAPDFVEPQYLFESVSEALNLFSTNSGATDYEYRENFVINNHEKLEVLSQSHLKYRFEQMSQIALSLRKTRLARLGTGSA